MICVRAVKKLLIVGSRTFCMCKEETHFGFIIVLKKATGPTISYALALVKTPPCIVGQVLELSS